MRIISFPSTLDILIQVLSKTMALFNSFAIRNLAFSRIFLLPLCVKNHTAPAEDDA